MDLELFDRSEEEVDVEMTIRTDSVASLERELVDQARKEARYNRLAAKANKQVANLNFDLEIVTAQIIKEICEEAEGKKKPIPATAVSELRKTKVPLDTRYQKTKRALIEATENANLLNGLVSSWQSRGYRLQELVKLADRMFWQPIVYKDKFTTPDQRIDRAGDALAD
ncbi:MAG: hypothetical protein KKD77_22430 [Gammaproteobacteria bacterium]|nr:hypothetical protein [Gammaproteobacteria bacterium]